MVGFLVRNSDEICRNGVCMECIVSDVTQKTENFVGFTGYAEEQIYIRY